MDASGLAALERELTRIPEITAARVVADDSGAIVEVHILSTPSKHAKQIVRDVQSVAMTTFGLDLDRRIVSVVQLDAVTSSKVERNGHHAEDEGEDVSAAGEPTVVLDDAESEEPDVIDDRIRIDSVTALRNGTHCTAQVVLIRGGDRATGVAEGISAGTSVVRLVAHATVSALRHLEPAAARVDVESASVVTLAGRPTAVTTVVVVVPPYEEILAGAAIVHSAGELDAVARSVLDATNRRLPQLR